MNKKTASKYLLDADIEFHQIESDFKEGGSPDQAHLLEHIKKVASVAEKSVSKLIKSKSGSKSGPVTTHSPAAYQALKEIVANVTTLAVEAGVVDKPRPKSTTRVRI